MRELVLVRKRGFEPPLGCPNQLLRLARLPFRHFRVLQQISPQAGTSSIAQALKADRPRAAGMAPVDGKRARASLASPPGKTGESDVYEQCVATIFNDVALTRASPSRVPTIVTLWPTWSFSFRLVAPTTSMSLLDFVT